MPSAAIPGIRRGVIALTVALACSSCAGQGGAHRATSVAHATETGGVTRDLGFASGPDMLPATFRSPSGAGGPVPGALIISGSGPTDRDGNDPQYRHLDTNRNFAGVLAGAGVASFRYDKIGSGAAGLGSHAGGKGIDFGLYAQEALDAYRTLARQREVDRRRLIVVGHSEGALFALWLADRLRGTPEAPRALVLAAPPGHRYLDLLSRQLTEQYHAAQSAGRLPAATAAAYIRDLRVVVGAIRTTGKPPAHFADPALASLFTPVNTAFLAQADRQDPFVLARRLAPGLPVLVLRGTKDVQVDASEVRRLMSGLARDHRAERADIPDADHVFKVVTGTPNPATDYPDPSRPFAPQVAPRLTAFLRGTFG